MEQSQAKAQHADAAGDIEPQPYDPAFRSTLTADQLIERTIAYAKPNPWRLFQVGWWAMLGRQRLEWELDFALQEAANDRAGPDELQAAVAGQPSASAPPAAARVTPIEAATGERQGRIVRTTAATVTILHGDRLNHSRRAKTSPLGGIDGSQYANLIRALRPQQWAKNGLVFVPLLLAGQFADADAFVDTVLAFLGLSFIASSTYLINDLWDIAEDRRHWSKCERPLASGRLKISMALAVAPLGILLGLLIGAMASFTVVAGLLAYLVITLAYSLVLKRLAFVDGLVLASLFTLRIGIGMIAADAPPSPWLIAVSMFLFTSLSFAKRYVEIIRVAARGGDVVRGRGYRVTDAPLVLAIGIASGFDAVGMMVVYVFDDAVAKSFYANRIFLWAFPVLLFAFISRMWLVCVRDEADDDLVAYALADKHSLVLLGLVVTCFMLAWLGPL